MAKICIYGAGSIGCYIGGRLLATGSVVNFIGRGRVPDDVRKHGLMLSSQENKWWQIPSFATNFSTEVTRAADADLVLFTVKAVDTAVAAAELARVVKPGAIIVGFQSGLGSAEILSASMPRHRVLEGLVSFNVVMLGPGIFHQASVGALDVRADIGLLPLLSSFSDAGLPLRMHTDLLPLQWGHVLWNLNNAMNALANLPLIEQLSQRSYRRCLSLVQAEALHLLAEADIKPARLSALPFGWTSRLLRLPNAFFMRLCGAMLEIDPLAHSSMSVDLDAGRTTEIDWINGDVLRLAQRLGRPAPLNARLCELVHDAEKRSVRHSWSGEDLLAELQHTLETQSSDTDCLRRNHSLSTRRHRPL